MSRDCFNGACAWVNPEGVSATFSFEVATVPPKVLEQRAPFHLTVTVSWMASGGIPRRASSRRS